MSSVWRNPELNVKEAFVKEEYDKLIHYSQDNSNLLLTAWNEGNEELLTKRLNRGSAIIHRLISWINRQNRYIQAVFELGVLKGIYSSLKQSLYYVSQENDNIRDYYKRYQYIQHLGEVVESLEKNGPLSHSDLSESIHIKASTLSDAMKNILPEGLINVSSSGKYKVYSLTDRGRRYSHQLKGQSLTQTPFIHQTTNSMATIEKLFQASRDDLFNQLLHANQQSINKPITIYTTKDDDPEYFEQYIIDKPHSFNNISSILKTNYPPQNDYFNNSQRKELTYF